MLLSGRSLVSSYQNSLSIDDCETLISGEGLSLWGGVDPATGIVIDTSHSLHNECVSNKILCLPSGRGSCTASQVLLELLLNDKAPRAILLRDVDALLCVGALVANHVFDIRSMDIVAVGNKTFQVLLDKQPARISLANTDEESSEHTSLTEQEQRRLDQAASSAEVMALHIMTKYARICGTTDYVKIAQAHIDGCTYIGPGGLKFARALVNHGGRVKVPTTLNSMSVDRQRWKDLQVPAEYATNAVALGDAYLQLGCKPSFTCAPYLLPNSIPKVGQNIAWGESNAVVYANSVLGARTEKYADYLDICAALLGMVPRTGVHLAENRFPQIHIDAHNVIRRLVCHDNALDDPDELFPILGHVCGRLSDGKVALLTGFELLEGDTTSDHLKAFCAAFGTTAASPLVHLAGVTPEAPLATALGWKKDLVTRTVTGEDIIESLHTLDSSTDEHDGESSVDLIALGNPHLSVAECQELLDLIRKIPKDKTTNAKKHKHVRIMACMSRELYETALEQGLVAPLEKFGVEFVSDTCWCMMLDPPVIPPSPDARIMTNSGKYAHYGPGLTGRSFYFGNMADCVQTAVTGARPFGSSLSHRIQDRLDAQQKRFMYSTAKKFLTKLVK